MPQVRVEVPTPPNPPIPPQIHIGGPDGIQILRPPTTARELSALRQRGSDLSRQLQSASGRREDLAQQLEDATGTNRAGIEQRIAQLDSRIMRIEAEIDANSRMIAAAPLNLVREETVVPPPGPFNLNPGQITGITIVGTIFVLFPLALAMARNMWRRGSRQAPAPVSHESIERMERLEQAVDAIAIEVERISEGQRFTTKLLAESTNTPLPGEVARIPGSTKR